MIRLLAYLLGYLPVIAFVHSPESAGGGFLTGFLHPIVEVDYLIAMVAVGLRGAFYASEQSRFYRSCFHQSWQFEL